jgi:hypothetical protein
MLRHAGERLDALLRAELMAVGRRRTATFGAFGQGAEPQVPSIGKINPAGG